MAIVVVDYDMGNVGSIVNMMKKLGHTAVVSADADTIRRADRLILPGVGAFDVGMGNLAARGLVDVLRDKVITQRTPVLGICLGMQLLFRHSAEGDTPCLGILDADVLRLAPAAGLPVPHMGWNSLVEQKSDPLLDGLGARDWYYFVHSYAAQPDSTTIASAEYGGRLAAVVRRNNFWGVQFHPERSSSAGARLLANFLRLT